jgi:site-specific DNA-methyltransferase (adenine-specific)
MRHRLQDTFGPDLSRYEVIGAPEDLASAEALAKDDRYKYEWWALGLVDARPAQDKKKGTDRGVDGHIYFFDDNSGKAKQIIVQVKSGHVSVPQVRDLIGVVQREKAAIGLFLTLQEPTKPMLHEAAEAGFYVPEYFPDQRFPRLQILTIAELLQGEHAQYPRYAPTATFRQASRRQKGADPQQMLL